MKKPKESGSEKNYKFTDHARARMRQRGIKENIVHCIVRFCDETKRLEGGVCSCRISKRRIEEMVFKKSIPASYEKLLKNVVAVLNPKTFEVITVLHPNERGRKGGRYRQGK